MAERLDDLRLAILENGESILVEVGDHALFVVDDGGVQQDLLYVGMEDKTARFGAGLLPLRGAPELGRGVGLGRAGSRLGTARRGLGRSRILGPDCQVKQK